MSLFALLKTKRAERAKLVTDANAILELSAKDKRSMTPEETTKFDKFHADADLIKIEVDRLERQVDAERSLAEGEQRQKDEKSQPGREDTKTENQPDPKKEEQLAKRAMRSWVAGGMANLSTEERAHVERRISQLPPEARALSAVTGNVGAYTVPQDFERTLDVAEKYYGGVLQSSEYLDTDNGQLLPYPSINDTANSAEETTENNTLNSSTDPAFGVVNFTAYMFDSAIVLVPLQLLQDGAFDMETFLSGRLVERIGRKINNKCTVGAGSTEPTGIVTAATAGPTSASGVAISYADLIGLEHSVDPSYRRAPGAGWMFNDSTLKALRLLVDGNGRPLFLAGGTTGDISQRSPDTLSGYPFFINQDMASIAVNNKTVLFGALKKYMIRRVRGTQIVRFGERYMDKLQIGLLAFQRYDGNLIDAGTHPVKSLVQAAS